MVEPYINIQDQDFHWYYIPKRLKEDFIKMEAEGKADYWVKFNDKYAEYRTGGAPHEEVDSIESTEGDIKKPTPEDFTFNGELMQPHFDNALKAWEKIQKLEQAAKEPPYNQLALDALRSFVEQYSPATRHEANTFFTTREIVNAIEDHTGFQLSNKEVFELMQRMEFKYEAFGGMDFNWLLKKD